MRPSTTRCVLLFLTRINSPMLPLASAMPIAFIDRPEPIACIEILSPLLTNVGVLRDWGRITLWVAILRFAMEPTTRPGFEKYPWFSRVTSRSSFARLPAVIICPLKIGRAATTTLSYAFNSRGTWSDQFFWSKQEIFKVSLPNLFLELKAYTLRGVLHVASLSRGSKRGSLVSMRL